MIRQSTAVLAVIFSVFFAATDSFADRGMMTISADPDIVLSEGAQRAVIAFNGTEEILILATDASASTPGKVLEFLPLPSVPTIQEYSPEVFDRATYLITRNAPTISERGKRNGEGRQGQVPGIELVNKTVIGPHSITVVKIESAEHFVAWITDLFKSEGIDTVPAKASEMKDIVAVYLGRGLTYFVFDTVTITADPTGIAPLAYRFRSEYLYYPLEISSKIPGSTEIDLFLITPGIPRKAALPKGFTIPEYVFPTNPLVEKSDVPPIPVSVSLDMADRVTLSPTVAALLPGWNTATYLTFVRYRGPMGGLFGDFVLKKADFSDADFGAVSRAIENRKTLSDYAPAGTVDRALVPADRAPAVTASADGLFTYYLRGGTYYSTRRIELSASYTSPAAIDGDPSTPFILAQGRTWTIDLGATEEIDTVDILAAVPIPDRDTTFTYGIRLLASDSGKFSGEQKMVGSGVIESYTQTDDTDDVSGRASLIRLTERPVRARYLRIEYIPYGAYNDIYLFEVMPWTKAR